MPIFKVYLRERHEASYEVRAADAEAATQAVLNGGGILTWRDFLDFTEPERWDIEAVGRDEDEEDEGPAGAPDDAPRRERPNIQERLRRAAVALGEQRAVPQARAHEQPDPVEDVDFEG